MHGHWLKGYLRDGKKIEGGGGGSGSAGPLVVTLSGSKRTADKTFAEIAEAIGTGRGAVAVLETDAEGSTCVTYKPFISVSLEGSACSAQYWDFDNEASKASLNEDANPDDYPYFKGGIS